MAVEAGKRTVEESYCFGTSLLGSERDKPTTPRKGFLFGSPISHALGPKLHNTLWTDLQLPMTFLSVDSMDKQDFLPLLRSSDCIGASITMPHKVSCMSDVDELRDEARIIGAINTIFVRLDARIGARRYIGANTDCMGIRDAFERSFAGVKQKVRGKVGLVIGGGGTARAAIYALWKFFGVREIYLVNRLDTEVRQIMLSMTAAGCQAKMTHVQSVEDAARCEAPVIVVGAVPDIPAQTDGEVQAKTVVLELLRKLRTRENEQEQEQEQEQDGFLLDMCYHPSPTTSLIKVARDSGWQVVSGIEALIAQGLAQDVLWLEKPIEDSVADEVSKVIRAALRAS